MNQDYRADIEFLARAIARGDDTGECHGRVAADKLAHAVLELLEDNDALSATLADTATALQHAADFFDQEMEKLRDLIDAQQENYDVVSDELALRTRTQVSTTEWPEDVPVIGGDDESEEFDEYDRRALAVGRVDDLTSGPEKP